MREIAGLIIPGPDGRILLTRSIGIAARLLCGHHPMPPELGAPADYELPFVAAAETRSSMKQLRNDFRAKYGLKVKVAEVLDSGMLISSEFPGAEENLTQSMPMCRLYRGELQTADCELDDDANRFINLRGHERLTPELPLGPYAHVVRWLIQNEELAL